MKYSLLILLSFSILSATSQQKTEIVKLTVPKIRVDQGNSSTIEIGVEVKDGYHIQANQLDNEYLIPTTLTIKGDTNIIVGKQVFPKSKKFRLEGSDDYWNVYDGSFVITILFKTTEIIQKGRYNLTATFHYQACDSKSCLSPRTINFSMPIEVTEQTD